MDHEESLIYLFILLPGYGKPAAARWARMTKECEIESGVHASPCKGTRQTLNDDENIAWATLLGVLEPPCRMLSDLTLPTGTGGKGRFMTATTCRFQQGNATNG
jgi:hypothetical protein